MSELIVGGKDLNNIGHCGTYYPTVKEQAELPHTTTFIMTWYDCKYYLPDSSKLVIVSGYIEDVDYYSTVGYYVEKENQWYSRDHGHEGEELVGVRIWADLPLPYKDTIERLYGGKDND